MKSDLRIVIDTGVVVSAVLLPASVPRQASYNSVMDTVDVETTVVGSVAGRTHPDQAIAARQNIGRRW